MAQYKTLVEQIYAKGGRNFLFLNVPAVSRSPDILGLGSEASQKHAAWLSVYNEYLQSMIQAFQDEHPDVRVKSFQNDNSQLLTEVRLRSYSTTHGIS